VPVRGVSEYGQEIGLLSCWKKKTDVPWREEQNKILRSRDRNFLSLRYFHVHLPQSILWTVLSDFRRRNEKSGGFCRMMGMLGVNSNIAKGKVSGRRRAFYFTRNKRLSSLSFQ